MIRMEVKIGNIDIEAMGNKQMLMSELCLFIDCFLIEICKKHPEATKEKLLEKICEAIFNSWEKEKEEENDKQDTTDYSNLFNT